MEVALRTLIFRTGAGFSKTAGLYICLCTSAPSDSSTGSTIVEPTTGGYARVDVPPLDANWTAASSTNGITTNASAINWTASGGNFGTITHIAICDAATNGNMLFHGALAASRTINDGDTFQIGAGSLSITLA